MTPGRELDAVVAEKIMGLRVKWATSYDGELHPVCPSLTDAGADDWEPCPWYSTDIADAWRIVEHLSNCGLLVFVGAFGWSDDENDEFEGWTAEIADADVRSTSSEAQSGAHAICLAALKHAGVEVPA